MIAGIFSGCHSVWVELALRFSGGSLTGQVLNLYLELVRFCHY